MRKLFSTSVLIVTIFSSLLASSTITQSQKTAPQQQSENEALHKFSIALRVGIDKLAFPQGLHDNRMYAWEERVDVGGVAHFYGIRLIDDGSWRETLLASVPGENITDENYQLLANDTVAKLADFKEKSEREERQGKLRAKGATLGSDGLSDEERLATKTFLATVQKTFSSRRDEFAAAQGERPFILIRVERALIIKGERTLVFSAGFESSDGSYNDYVVHSVAFAELVHIAKIPADLNREAERTVADLLTFVKNYMSNNTSPR